MSKVLNPKQKLFAAEYLIDLNATQAAIRAGYSKKTANEQAARLLVNVSVRTEIDRLMMKRSEKTEITAEMVLKELAKIAFFDIRRLYDENGNLVPIHKLDDVTAASIAGVDVVEMAGAMEINTDNDIKHIAMHTKKVKLADKRAALVDVGKHLGMFVTEVKLIAPEPVYVAPKLEKDEWMMQHLGHTNLRLIK